MSFFADPDNPQPEEVRAWAYESGVIEPVQDFDLILSWARHEMAYLDLANDPACPTQRYFLRILYLIVGDAVREGFSSVPEPVIRGFIDLGDGYSSNAIRVWQQRSRALLADPSLFDYDLWCAGGYASVSRT